MVLKYSLIFVIINTLVVCESALVDTLKKCTLKDEDCHKEFMHDLLNRLAKDGAPEIDIPPIDPMSISNVTVKIIDLIEMTIVEGKVKGIKDCVIDRFVKNVEKKKVFLDLTCDATLKGNYKLFAEAPIVQSLLNAKSVRGEGNGKIKIVKLQLKIVFPISLIKRNEELFITCKREETKYDFAVLGTMLFFADQLYIGDVESSKDVTAIMNQSWQVLMPSFGRPFMDKVMEIVIGFMCQFHDKVPTKYYLSDDLSPYLE